MADLTLRVPASLGGERLVDVCWARLGVVAKRAVGPMITAGAITVDGRAARIAQRVAPHALLAVDAAALAAAARARTTTPPAPGRLHLVHEDEALLVVDKPSGLHVHPMGAHRGDTLLGRVLWRAGGRAGRPWTAYRPHAAHRLDRPTSGLLVIAKGDVVRDAIQRLLEGGHVQRTYTAQVEGVVADAAGTIDLPIGRDAADPRRRAVRPVQDGGQPALTRFQVVGRRAGTTALSLTLGTGRTHQLRAHLAHLGHPIVGDVRYGAAAVGPPPDPVVGDAIALRAVGLSLPHPVDGRPLRLIAGPAPDGDQPSS